jgi:hypothetical protein
MQHIIFSSLDHQGLDDEPRVTVDPEHATTVVRDRAVLERIEALRLEAATPAAGPG